MTTSHISATYSHLSKTAATILLAACATIHPALAEPSGSLPDSLSVDLHEIDVTALKSGSNLRSTPMASTTIGTMEIDRLNIATVKGASQLVPNFYVPDYGSRVTSSIYVRGLGARIDQPAVGLNVDNVAFLNKDNYDFDLPDISKIEILRGPQSTMYGRNTMAGVVNIYTLSPKHFQGWKLAASFAAPFQTKLSAGYYSMLSPQLGMSINALYTHTTGDHRNTYNNSRIGSENAGTLRWKTVWDPRSNFTLENTAALQLNEQNGYPYEYVKTGKISYNDSCYYHRFALTDGLTINWLPSEHVSITGISSFQYLKDDLTLDNDFLPDSYFTLSQRRHEWIITQDIIARGNVAGNTYQWLGGLFGFYRSSHTDAPVTFLDDGIANLIEANANKYFPDYPMIWDERTFPLSCRFDTPMRGAALYHQSTLNIGNWSLSAGLRLDYERPGITYDNSCHTSYTIYDLSGGAVPSVYDRCIVNIADRGHLSKSFTQLLPKFTLTYRLPSGLGNVYANMAKGYKSGGFNTQMFSDVLQQKLMSLVGIAELYDVDEIISYKPEWSWNYEIGAHLNIPDARINADLAAFWIDCYDQQLTVFPNGNTTGRMMTNAGHTRSIGFEASVSWRINDRWRWDVAYGMTDARFRMFDNGIADYKGNHVPYAPHNTLWTNLRYQLPLHTGTLKGLECNINTRGIGEIYWDDANEYRQPFYFVPGASVILRGNPGWEAEAWCTNMTDTDYNVFSFVSIGHRFVQKGQGIRGGITLRLTID